MLISNTDTGVSQQLVTNSSGYFEAPLMQPGNYEVTVEMAGFKRAAAPTASPAARCTSCRSAGTGIG